MNTEAMDRNRVLAEPWGLVLLKGLAAIILGILLLVAPGTTLLAFVEVIGAYWLVSGVLGIIHLFVDRRHWGWKLLFGILGIIAGILVFLNPAVSTILVPASLVIVIGAAGVVMGIIYLIRAFSGAGWGAGILGIIDIIFGIVLLSSPLMALMVFPLVMGVFFIVGGLIDVIMSFSLRGRPRPVVPVMRAPEPQGIPSTGEKEDNPEVMKDPLK